MADLLRLPVSATARDHRADRNARAQLRRADRQAQEIGHG
jgi:hypothetical protein